MTKKLRPSTKTLLAMLFLLPAADVAAQEASGGGFMTAIAEFFEELDGWLLDEFVFRVFPE